MATTAADRLMKQVVNDPGLMSELGTTGLEQYKGLIHEEFLHKLQGRLGILAYREMELNDPIVGAMLYALEMLMRSVSWEVEAVSDSTEDEANAVFVEEVLGDMEHDWADLIGEWMAAPVYGWCGFEIVYKLRNGYSRDADLSSKHSDGKLGISKLAIRHPVTLYRWHMDDERGGRILAMEQQHLSDRAIIPAEKLLLFTVLARKGNPEGMSMLRRCFVPYYRKVHTEEIESIGIERELAGLPVIKAPPSWFLSTASDDEKALLAYMKKVLRRLKTDEQAGLLLPKFMDTNGNALLEFDLVSTGGRRAVDTGPVKEYYSRQMAMSILMDVIMVGHEKVGSYALASSKTNLMGISIGALLDSIERVINRDLIPRLMILNGLPPEASPKVRHGDMETPDLEILGTFVDRLNAAGLDLFPTKTGELERFLARAAGMPADFADDAPERYQERQDMKDAAREALASGPAAPPPGTPAADDEDDEE